MNYIYKKLRKKEKKTKIGDKENNLSDQGTHKEKINEGFKNVDYQDLEGMVFEKELTYDEVEKILDMKYIPTSSTV